jgi:hypothetical protein
MSNLSSNLSLMMLVFPPSPQAGVHGLEATQTERGSI